MTKYEWESELKKNIHRLPDEEISRVMEYYDELFADKAERGYGEFEIVAQFGNPVDVADKILSEYDGELREAATVPPPVLPRREQPAAALPVREEKQEDKREEQTAPPPVAEEKKKVAKEKRTFKGERLALFVILNIFTGFLLFIAVGVVWIVAAAITVSGFACAVGGGVGVIGSCITLLQGHAAVGFAEIGMCVALSGVGILLCVLCVKSLKQIGILTGKMFAGIGHWIWPKEVKYE